MKITFVDLSNLDAYYAVAALFLYMHIVQCGPRLILKVPKREFLDHDFFA